MKRKSEMDKYPLTCIEEAEVRNEQCKSFCSKLKDKDDRAKCFKECRQTLDMDIDVCREAHALEYLESVGSEPKKLSNMWLETGWFKK